MTKSHRTRAIMVNTALELIPPIVRETLIEDANFREMYGLTSDAMLSINFNESSILVQRSKLYNAAREILSGTLVQEVSDNNGEIWKLENASKKGELPRLELSCGRRCLILPNLVGLSPEKTIRLRYFAEIASNVNLPNNERERWYKVLSERSFVDEEVDAFYCDCQDTPIEQTKSIYSKIMEGNLAASILVPSSRRYFERLVGTFDGCISINDYAVNIGKPFFKQLLSWRHYDGFLFSLLLSSHFALTAEIDVSKLSREEFIHAFEFLDKNGDIISQIGAIEVGLRVLAERPEIEPNLIRIIKRLRDDDVNAQDSGFNLILALFILIDGELSRIRLFTKEPPFYRRLATLSQAALIFQQIKDTGVDIKSFCEWAFNNWREQYYLQSFVDMRMEPCWTPDFATPSQIKADILGRIMITANKYEQNIKDGELHDLIFATSSESIYSLCEFPYSYYPGPLEGSEDIPKSLLNEVSETIEASLCEETVTVKSFIALVNSAMIFQITNNQAEMAAEALKRGSYRLANIENRSQFLSVLYGLAMVAAITRSRVLADELRILIRIYRRDLQYTLAIDEVMKIYFIAAASRKDLKEWRDFIGECLTEMAFSDLKGDDGEVFHSHVQYLCHIVPELWVSCGRAEAALAAYNARN